MENIKNFISYHVDTIYFCVALVVSFFYGGFAKRIFWSKEQRIQVTQEFGWFGSLHQFWLNFICSVVGWFLFYQFIVAIRDIGIKGLTFVHIVLLVFGMIGIVGWLPLTLLGVVKSFHKLAQKSINKILSD